MPDDTGSEPDARRSLEDPARALQSLIAFARSMLQQQTFEDLLWDIADKVGELLGFEDCVVYVAAGDQLVQAAAYGVKHPGGRHIHNPIVVRFGQGIVGTVAATGRPERVADTARDPRYIADAFAGRSELAVPITFAGRVLGVLDSESQQLDGFTAADETMFCTIAAIAAPRIASALTQREHTAAVAALARAEAQHESRERLLREERAASLARLAGGVAHDFNNLLGAILGNITLAQATALPTTTARLLEEAVEGCVRAKELTEQLAAFVRGESPQRRTGSIERVLRSSVALALRGCRVTASFDIDPELWPVSCNPGQIGQVLHNLALNAAQAMTEGDTPGSRFAVRARNVTIAGRDVVEVRCADDGPGVPAALRTRIFDPYFTTRPAGSGLGLSTSYWIARHHGGSLELVDGDGRGAAFVLRLPAVTDGSPDAPPLLRPRQPRLRVLLLEGAGPAAAAAALRELDHDVDAATDFTDWVQRSVAARAAGCPYELAVLEQPGGDSETEALLQALRAVAPDLPAIVVGGPGDAAPPLPAPWRRVPQACSAAELAQAIADVTSSARP